MQSTPSPAAAAIQLRLALRARRLTVDGDRSLAARAQATVAAAARPLFGCMDAIGAARLGPVACAVVTRWGRAGGVR